MAQYNNIFKITHNNVLPEKGHILISEPFLQDAYFQRSVVLLVEHDKKGSMGFVLNKKLEMNLNKELWSIIYETCKFGDNFYEVIPDSYENPHEIVRIRYLDPNKVNRIEKNGKLAFYTYTTDMKENDGEFDERNERDAKKMLQYRLQPWQIIHFRIADKDFYPYGGSLLKSGVKCFRRLTMLGTRW
jgi:hypothetical protein